MAEYLRSVTVTVVVDTNKRTETETYELREDETTDELMARVAEDVRDTLGVNA